MASDDSAQPERIESRSENTENASAGLSSSADLSSPSSNDQIREMERSNVQGSQGLLNSWNNFSLDMGAGKGADGKSSEAGKENNSKTEQSKGTGNLRPDKEAASAESMDKAGTRSLSGQIDNAKIGQEMSKKNDNSGYYKQEKMHQSELAHRPGSAGGSHGPGGRPSSGGSSSAGDMHSAATNTQKSSEPGAQQAVQRRHR